MKFALLAALLPLVAFSDPKPPAPALEVSLDAGRGILAGTAPAFATLTFRNAGAERVPLDAARALGKGLRFKATELTPGVTESLDAMKAELADVGAAPAEPYFVPPGGALSKQVDLRFLVPLEGRADAGDLWFEDGDLKSAPVRLDLVEDLTKTLIVFETSKGVMKATVDPEHAPFASRNFVRHVQKGTYDGTLFHRVIKGFMAQAGDPNTKGGDPQSFGAGGIPYNGRKLPFEASPDVKHVRGTLSMARKGDPASSDPTLAQRTVQMMLILEGKNPQDQAAMAARQAELRKEGFFRDRAPFLESSGSQFYFCFQRAEHLDGSYTTFGKLVDGDDVLKQIEATPTVPGDRPVEPIKILKARLEKKP